MPARHKITVTFPDTDIHSWVIHNARLAERTPEQQIRYVLRSAFQREKDARATAGELPTAEHANGNA